MPLPILKASWKALLIGVLALTHTRCAQADAPPCFPGEPNAFEKDLQIMQTDEGCVAYVHCDVGHQWVISRVFGNWAECKAALAAVDLATWLGLDHDQKTALYNSMMVGKQPTAEDDLLIQKANNLAHPADPPPSGLIVRKPRVYKESGQVNGKITFDIVGSVSLKVETPCDVTVKVGRYYRIDRDKVTYPPGTIKPKVALAECD